jgi:hypothetical protein
MNKKLFVLEQNKGINFIMCKFNKHLQPNGLYYAFFATKSQSLAFALFCNQKPKPGFIIFKGKKLNY